MAKNKKTKKQKTSSQKEREAALNDLRNKMAVDVSYDMGHRNGFYNCLTIMMYSIMQCTNYKHNGLMKIWNKTLDVAEALQMPETGLKHEILVLALAEEAGIVVDEADVKRARRAVEKTNGKANPEYRKIVEEAMQRYAEIVEARLAAENDSMGVKGNE